jgi:hypothetical protein
LSGTLRVEEKGVAAEGPAPFSLQKALPDLDQSSEACRALAVLQHSGEVPVDSAYFRKLADECREIAAGVEDPRTKQALLTAADNYEKAATYTDVMIARSPAKPA